jgi:hypothetical protein
MSTNAPSYTARLIAQRAARLTSTTKVATKLASALFKPDYDEIVRCARAAARQKPPAVPYAAQYEELMKDPAFLQRLNAQRIEADVARIRANAGLTPAPLATEARTILAHYDSALLAKIDSH